MGREFTGCLRTQLGFIERSVRQFNEGTEDEAFRIATALRVLFHDTPNSTSLLTHMNSTDIPVITSIPTNGYVSVSHFPFHHMVQLEKRKIPVFGRFPIYRKEIKATEWWNQGVIWINRKWVTRKQVVLWLANKDGGAHVDKELPEDYVALMETMKFFVDYSEEKIPIKQPLILTWQLGYEVLMSPSFKALASEIFP